MLDLNALESFRVAAETLNFSRAAERRNTVQSAISAHIRKLERDLGHALFERGRGRSMRLTAKGRTFLSYARRILDLSTEAVDATRERRDRTTIRLGTTVTLALSVVSRALEAFIGDGEDVQLHILCDRSDALLSRLDEGSIDLAFMMDQGKDPRRSLVQSSQLAWVAGQALDLPPGAAAPLVFMTDGRDLRRYAFDALDRAGREGFIAHLSPDPIGVRSFVAGNQAITVMPAVAVAPPLRIVDAAFALPPLNRVQLALYRAPGCDRRIAAAFEDAVRADFAAA